MTRITSFSNPLLLGFETMEKTLDRLGNKSTEGYPPYNIERIYGGDRNDRLRITLAVAGFSPDELEVTVEDNQLIIRGRQADDDNERDFLHRGIAARQFQRAFVLADGMTVTNADLKNGLLSIELERPIPEKRIKRIMISASDDE